MKPHFKQTSHILKRVLLVFFYFYTSITLSADKLTPTPLMQQEGKWLVQALQQAHFNKVSINDLNSTGFIHSYLKKLDKQKLYFTQSHVNEFLERYSPPLITYFEQGNLFPGFEIYNIYKEKSLQRSEWVLNYLNRDFNFETDSSYQTNRDELPWETNEIDLNNTWKNLIKFEILGEILSAYDTNMTFLEFKGEKFTTISKDSKEKVRKRYERWSKSIKDFEATDVQELYLKLMVNK